MLKLINEVEENGIVYNSKGDLIAGSFTHAVSNDEGSPSQPAELFIIGETPYLPGGWAGSTKGKWYTFTNNFVQDKGPYVEQLPTPPAFQDLSNYNISWVVGPATGPTPAVALSPSSVGIGNLANNYEFTIHPDSGYGGGFPATWTQEWTVTIVNNARPITGVPPDQVVWVITASCTIDPV